MKRLIGAGLSILVFSALSASTSKAQTRYEYQLGLTHHQTPAIKGEPAVQMAVQLPTAPSTQSASIPAQGIVPIRPVTSGNPYAGQK